MAVYQVLYWKEIPAQVRAFKGKRAISRQMPERFQEEIDRVAMEEGLAGTDDYLNQWQWSEKQERPREAEEVLSAILVELEAEYERRARKERE